MNRRSNAVNGRCDSHLIRRTAKIIFALPTALTATGVFRSFRSGSSTIPWAWLGSRESAQSSALDCLAVKVIRRRGKLKLQRRRQPAGVAVNV